MNDASAQIDSRRRSVTVGYKSTVLQEKNWQVLQMLVEEAPRIVSRTEIIDSIWQGNYQTGEKGLNQALWVLRSALGDDARHPRFIRTVPRVGYQWMRAGTSRRSDVAQKSRWGAGAAAATAAFVLMTTAVAYLTKTSTDVDGDVKSLSSHLATSAYLRNQDIVVEMSDGCRGIFRNSGGKEFGVPILSSDGSHVAFTVREFSDCRLVSFDLKNGEQIDFGQCPSEVI